MDATDGDASERGASPPSPIGLTKAAERIGFEKPTLKEQITNQVLGLFRLSLVFTLGFAAVLVAIDAVFIWEKIISPDQRLMKDNVIMTFVTATVVQVGAALAGIVLAVFKSKDGEQ